MIFIETFAIKNERLSSQSTYEAKIKESYHSLFGFTLENLQEQKEFQKTQTLKI